MINQKMPISVGWDFLAYYLGVLGNSGLRSGVPSSAASPVRGGATASTSVAPEVSGFRFFFWFFGRC